MDPIGGYMACLLGSIFAVWDGLGPHFGGLGDILGMAWVPDWPGDFRMGWIALRLEREQCLAGSRDPGHGLGRWWIWYFWALLSTNN